MLMPVGFIGIAPNYAMQPTPKPLHGLGTLAALGAADLRRWASQNREHLWHLVRVSHLT